MSTLRFTYPAAQRDRTAAYLAALHCIVPVPLAGHPGLWTRTRIHQEGETMHVEAVALKLTPPSEEPAAP